MANVTFEDLPLFNISEREIDPSKVLKTCKHHGNLYLKDVNKDKKRLDGRYSWKCKKCVKKIHANNYKKNRDKILKRARDTKEKDPEKVRLIKLYSRRRNYYKWREINNERQKKDCENLEDWYVRKAIYDTHKRRGKIKLDIPPELIELKRIMIILKREIKKQALQSRG